MPHDHSPHPASINRDSKDYWNKRAATFTRYATEDYELWLMDLLSPAMGETILDMGCATGTLALPLARAGHHVHACDFAEAMLAILDQRATAENLPITSHLLAWDEDWSLAGLGENSVDCAFASRSLMSDHTLSRISKLDATARVKAAVVVPNSLPPSSDPRLLTYLGRKAKRPSTVPEVMRSLRYLGRIPVTATTNTFRPMRFNSFDEARADLRRLARPEPFTPREQRLFDAYARDHFVEVPAVQPMSDVPGHDSDSAQTQWVLNYPLPVVWTFIGWRTDGSEWE